MLSSFHPGGTEYQTTELVRRLPPDKWDVHVACFHREGAWLSRVTGRAASVEEFPIRSFKSQSTLREMRRFADWCRDLRIEVVHAADLYANIFALPAAATARVPFRVGSRRELNPDKTFGLIALQRTAYACAHRVLANSKAAADRLRLERVPVGRIVVVHNGLDLARFDGTHVAETDTLITVANLRPEKGHATLFEAFARVQRYRPGVRLVLVGDGPERERLTALAVRLGIDGSIRFVGHREDVPALIGGAAVVIVPSLSEAFPNAALEAMAAGRPVVASAVGGLVELITDGLDGVLVPAADPDAMADAIERLLADPVRRRELGGAARATIESRYSFDRMVSAVEALYSSELSRRGSAAPAPVAVS